MIANAINLCSGWPVESFSFTGAKYRGVYGANLSAGDNDLYTVPAGKKAQFMNITFYNSSGTGRVATPQIKISGTYYQVTFAPTVGSLGVATSQPSIIANAGEILSVNLATGATGFNIRAVVIEFDDSVGLKSARVLSLASGNNTPNLVPCWLYE